MLFLNLVSVFNKDYVDIVNFFSNQPSKILVSLLLVFAYFFSALSISEVFEDYIHDEKIKNVANKNFEYICYNNSFNYNYNNI